MWSLSATAERSARRCAHCLRIGPDNALHLSVQNLSLTRLERSLEGWRVVCVNELPGY